MNLEIFLFCKGIIWLLLDSLKRSLILVYRINIFLDDKDNIESVMKDFTPNKNILKEGVKIYVSNQEERQKPFLKRPLKARPKLGDLQRFSFHNIHESISKPKPIRILCSNNLSRKGFPSESHFYGSKRTEVTKYDPTQLFRIYSF